MLEFVLVLVAKMYSPVTNGADYLSHFLSTSFNANNLLGHRYGLTFYSSDACCAVSIPEILPA